MKPFVAVLALLAPPFAALVPQDEGGATPAETDVLTQEQLERMRDEIVPELEEIRGAAFRAPVPVAIATKAGLREYALEMAERTTSPEQLRAVGEVAQLLGLVPPDMDVLEATLRMIEGQVGGFYDPYGEKFWIMESFGGDLARIIMAHELTHALDDQLYDIDGTIDGLSGSSDASFAYHAVVEGSGTAAMNRWTIQKMAELDMEAVQEGSSLGMEALEEAPAFLWKPLLGVYLRGAAFLARSGSVMVGQMKAPEATDVERAFREPPRSSEQILHPEKYWDEGRRDDPVPVRLVTANVPSGWSVVDDDDLGEIGYALLFEAREDRGGLPSNPLAIMAVKYTNRAAEGWGGDRFVLLEKGSGRVVHLTSVWDGEEDAVEAETALEKQRATFEEAAAAVAARLAAGGEPAATEVRLAREGRRVDLTVAVGGGEAAAVAASWFEVGAEAPAEQGD